MCLVSAHPTTMVAAYFDAERLSFDDSYKTETQWVSGKTLTLWTELLSILNSCLCKNTEANRRRKFILHPCLVGSG